MSKIKAKSHKGIQKRFKVTATGKIKHKRAGSSHLNSHKSGKQIRRLRKKPTLKMTAEARRMRFALLKERRAMLALKRSQAVGAEVSVEEQATAGV
ncbi:MAG: ribosomal protein [Planctomycetota bacterium]|jgi:large subunit ribosomal protein L35